MPATTMRTWLKDNLAVALTVGGVVLYVVLRLPYAVYYGRLGADPEDVGLGYVETLARSTVGVGMVVLVVAAAAAVTVFIGALLIVYGRITAVLLSGDRPSSKHLREFDDEAWASERAKGVRIIRRILGASGEDVDALMELADTRRRLLREPDQTDEVRALDADLRQRSNRMLVRLGVESAARWARRLAGVAATITFVTAVVLLPIRAYRDAGLVRGCLSPKLGTTANGRFAIRGSEARIGRLQADGTTRPVLADRTLRYLGRTDDRVVLFDCAADETVVLPGSDLMVVSVPDE